MLSCLGYIGERISVLKRMLPFIYSTLKTNTIYMGKYIVNLQMNSTTSKKITVAIAVMIAISAIPSVTVQAHTPNFMPYGEIAQEDEPFYGHDGALYLNVVPNPGNGMFMKLTDIDTDYSIDQAIERFHIDEDTTHFNVQPSLYSETELVYQLDDDLQFQLIGVVQ